jgi:hypothetical protein
MSPIFLPKSEEDKENTRRCLKWISQFERLPNTKKNDDETYSVNNGSIHVSIRSYPDNHQACLDDEWIRQFKALPDVRENPNAHGTYDVLGGLIRVSLKVNSGA